MAANPLDDMRTLVTGSTRGLGETIAKTLAVDGAWVVVSGRDETDFQRVVSEIQQAGGRADGISADLSIASEARRLGEAAVARLGHLDILVNNAGMSIREPLWEVSEENLDYQLNVDFRSYFVLAQIAARSMIPRERGRIINISTCGASQAHPATAVYDASKAAVEALTRNLASELGRFNISAVGISPGYVPIRPGAEDEPDMQRIAESVIPLRRPGTADDIAATVRFFARPESCWISGPTLLVDGGRMARMPQAVLG